MTPQELRSSILQLAIQGKLVEQRPEEGTGEELYQQIQAEKKRLIQEGKIKKEKPLPEIAEDEVPFEIPEGWKWVRLSRIASVLNGDRGKNYPAKSTLLHEGIPFISALNLDGKGVIDDDNLLCMSEQQYDRLGNGKLIKGDIVVCIRGSLGKHGRYPYERGAIASSLVILRLFLNHQVAAEFLMMYLDTPLFFSEIQKYNNGTAQPNLAANCLEQFLFPLPPLAEQKRIVAKIEELLPYLDRYEKAWNRLEEFNRRFPADMQKSILQMAIQGKLVEQRPEEGTGEELYRQIQAEKQALIKAGKIKKEKPLPEIAEDEVPFEIPEGWKWCRLLDLCSLIGDIDHNMPKSVDKNHGVLFLSAKDLLDDGSINYIDNVKYISNEDYDRLSRKVKPQLGDIVYSRIGACLGKARTVKSEVKFLVSYSCCIIRSIQIDVDYLRYYLESPIILAHSVKARQSIGVPDLGMGEIKKYFIALPPLAEQKRIVERLEELLPVCERLK